MGPGTVEIIHCLLTGVCPTVDEKGKHGARFGDALWHGQQKVAKTERANNSKIPRIGVGGVAVEVKG